MNVNPLNWDAPYLLIVGALFVIVMCRANATYWVGRLVARGMERTRVATVMESPGYRRATVTLNRWGAPVVSASFLTIGFQTLVNLSAGATRMPLPRYLPAVSIGCLMWAFLYGTVGYAGAEAVGMLWQRNPVAAVFVGVLVVSALMLFIVKRVREARRPALEPVVID